MSIPKAFGMGVWVAFGMPAEKEKPEVLAQRLVGIGAQWVALRSGQSKHVDGYYNATRMKRAIDAYHEAGLSVMSWHYAFPGNTAWDVSHVTGLYQMGVDAHIIDAEIEWTGKHAEAVAYGKAMAPLLEDGRILCHAPLGWSSYHPNWPYREFGDFCEWTMPQMYWTELVHGKYSKPFESELARWNDTYSETDILGEFSSYAPIGSSYGNESVFAKGAPGKLYLDDCEKFLKHVEGKQTWSWYSAEAAPGWWWDWAAQKHKERQSNIHPPVVGNPIGENNV